MAITGTMIFVYYLFVKSLQVGISFKNWAPVDFMGVQFWRFHYVAECLDSRLKMAAWWHALLIYRQVSNIRRTLVDNKIVDHSDVVGASPVGAAPTTSSFST